MTRRIIRGVRVATPRGIEPASVFIDDGRISYVSSYEDIPRQCNAEELGKSVLMPGLICAGMEDEEGQALLGGITSLLSNPLRAIDCSELTLYLSVRWTEMRDRDERLETFIDRWSTQPASLAGLGNRKGHIIKGFDADFVVWNPEYTVTGTDPLLFGLIRQVIVAGETVIKDGKRLQS